MESLKQITTLLTSLNGSGHDANTLLIGMGSAIVLLPILGFCARFIWKKLKLLKPPAVPALCGCEPPGTDLKLIAPGFWERCSLAIDYLRTRREWRYEKPWVMLLGEHGAGKSSLLASMSPSLRQALHGRSEQLAIKGTQWHDLNKGFIIDPNGNLPFNAELTDGVTEADHSSAVKLWDRTLNQLDALRPERALDGIVLVISAASLLNNSLEQRLANAENIRLQLHRIEQHFEFALPVYVVVTALDCVEGFSAFWRSQPTSRQEEIIGWSAPAQYNDGPPDAWAEAAFKQVGLQLKPLQLEAIALGDRVAAPDADQFFLFPRNFQQLKEPFQQCLSIIFQATPWQTTFFCRGIYFTGAIAATTDTPEAQEAPRQDVSFVSDLLLKKILGEPGLARPTRAGLWSRNTLIRRLQIAMVASFATLLMAFSLVCFHINTQVQDVIVALERVQQLQANIPGESSCVAQETVYELLRQISSIDVEARSWLIPLSFFDKRLSQQSASLVAHDAFKNIILPGIACQIKQRAIAINNPVPTIASDEISYPLARDALLGYVQQVNDLEKNMAGLKNLLATPSLSKEKDVLPDFIKLTEYAYGSALTLASKSNHYLLAASLNNLNHIGYKGDVRLPDNFKHNVSVQISALAQQANVQIMAELEQGSNRLNLLEQKQTPILANIKSFSTWLRWVRESWLGSSPTKNPISAIKKELSEKLHVLVRDYVYPEDAFNAAIAQFDVATQYPIAMDTLNKVQLPVYGSLFTMQNKRLDLNPKLLSELLGLQALSTLDYMKIEPALNFVCQGNVSNWNVAYLNQGASYAKQYQGLISNPSLKDGVENSLYQQLASYQLELALNNSLQQAQTTGSPLATPKSGSTTATGGINEQQQSAASANFAKLLAPITALQDIFNEQDFSESTASLDKCVSDFANGNLENIQALASESMLYQTTLSASSSGAATGTSTSHLFDLGTTAVIKDYLAQQFSRVQILTAYATPFLDYLDNGDTNNSENAPYWSNTANELQRFTQAKDPNAQATVLNNLYLNQLPGLDNSNCSSIISAYNAPEYGNDLFSDYRQQIEEDVKSLCSGTRTTQATSLYQKLAARFNRDLSGRYPFGALKSSDASLATVKAFFNDYEANKEALSQSVAGLTGASWDARRNFLAQLDSVANFLHNSLTPTRGSNALISLGVNFRALAGEGSDQVSSWRLSSASKSIAYPNQGNNLDWPLGQALTLDLGWANQSVWRPVIATAANDLQVKGSTASFSAAGNWALLRLIENHSPHSGATLDTLSANTELLEFNVPLIGAEKAGKASTANATLYVSLQLSSIDPKTMAPVSLKLPDTFPTAAPQ